MGNSQKIELLAPAGTIEAVAMVLDAGADAVYVGGKKFNMRRHRSSYNLTSSELRDAVAMAHERNCKLYITLNNLMIESERAEVRETLSEIGEIGPDAIIVQDLGVAALAREVCVHIPLHASTMMNIHNAEAASTLKLMGFTRVITSRDIPLDAIRQIGEVADIETECFIHGDICIAQSGQCLCSGIAFGESSNQGRCMKPCRWQWNLLSLKGEAAGKNRNNGFLLAVKDLCLYEHIPEIIRSGIVSLKIEGRMRTAETLAQIVSAYRAAIDAYLDDPVNYVTNANVMTSLQSRRVRNLTTGHAFGNPDSGLVDSSGRREPRFFSHAAPAPTLTLKPNAEPKSPAESFELITHVAGANGAEAALEAGADAIYIGGDVFTRRRTDIDLAWLASFADRAAEHSARIAFLCPRISDEDDMNELRNWLGQLRRVRSLGIGVSNLGELKIARSMKFRDITADFSFNVMNSVAADELSTLGVTRITASVELNYQDLCDFNALTRMPIEIIGQGPLAAMVMEHCVIADANGNPPDRVCDKECRRNAFALQDSSGQEFHIECDSRCRNHLFMPTDICMLPNLSHIIATGATGLRIEAHLDKPHVITEVVGTYRNAIDALCAGKEYDAAALVENIRNATQRPLSDGALAFDEMEFSTQKDNITR